MVVRTDESLDQEVRLNARWDDARFGGLEDPIDQSFSGEERNKWFLNVADTQGRNFVDLSTLSGLDSIGDGRVFAIGDFNRDGRSDIALTNANAPLLNLFQNQINTNHQFVAFRFQGGMTATRPTDGSWSTRDGYGSVITLAFADGMTIQREFRCGEGFAAQNSDTLLVGIGDRRQVQKIQIQWPSGKQHAIENTPSSTLVTFLEDDAQGKTSATIAPYLVDSADHDVQQD